MSRPVVISVLPMPRTTFRQSTVTQGRGSPTGSYVGRRARWAEAPHGRSPFPPVASRAVPMAVAIRFRSAVALLGRFPALAGVDLDVAGGEVVLVQGPNGAGKTSLLRACAGLLAVVGGQANVLGHDLRRDRHTVRRSIGLFGHSTFLYEDLTVADNVRFAVRASAGDVARVDASLTRLGLDGRLRDVAVGRLSAGQRRRAALACLLARSPRLWLLDEPHAGLDAEH